jgi:nucleoid DNA-binding protein
MIKIKKPNITKKNLSKNISKKTGLSSLYTSKITDDFITILKDMIKSNKLNIKNFGTFRVINKNERIGINPRNKKEYKVSSRRSLSFLASKKINLKIN